MSAAPAEVEEPVARRYEIQRRLGKGAYGIVWKARDRRTGASVAVKKIFDAFRNRTDAQRTFREIVFLQEFGGHPNIIQLLNVIRAQNDKDIYLVFESMETDLHAVIKKGNLLKDIHKCYILYQLLKATKFIHSGNVIHRDQKPSNILLDTNCFVKLCDFGLARSLCQIHKDECTPALTEYVATRWYRAPEILLASKCYTKGVDMWSIGCILGEMFLGKPLFPGTSTVNQIEQILRIIPPPSAEDMEAFHSGCRNSVINHMSCQQQLSFEDLLPSSTPPQALDLLKRLLVFNPEKRLTAEAALEHPYMQRFHCAAREPALDYSVTLPLADDVQLSVAEYRNKVYELLLEWKAHNQCQKQHLQRQPFRSGSPLQAQGDSSRGVVAASQQRVKEARNPYSKPKLSSTFFNPTISAAAQSVLPPGNVARGLSVACLQQQKAPVYRHLGRQVFNGQTDPMPPAVLGEPHLNNVRNGPEGAGQALSPVLKPLSLSSQAQEAVFNQHLVRKEFVPGKAASFQNTRNPESRGKEVPSFPKPSRKMFQVTANVGAAGDPKAHLGSYSQSYGTICKSALQLLPVSNAPSAQQP